MYSMCCVSAFFVTAVSSVTRVRSTLLLHNSVYNWFFRVVLTLLISCCQCIHMYVRTYVRMLYATILQCYSVPVPVPIRPSLLCSHWTEGPCMAMLLPMEQWACTTGSTGCGEPRWGVGAQPCAYVCIRTYVRMYVVQYVHGRSRNICTYMLLCWGGGSAIAVSTWHVQVMQSQ